MLSIVMLIIGLAYAVASIYLLYTDTDGNTCSLWCSSIAVCLITFSMIIQYESKNSPTAMDVYQNKTTLEITYVDGVPVDSVVVFKEQLKDK